MKIIDFKCKTKNRELEIIPLSDIHIGDEGFNLQLFNDTITYILEEPNRYCILNGDIINNAIKTSVSDVYSEQLSPTDQILYANKLLLPIRDRIISVCSGNHEDRTFKNDGVDLTMWLCAELGLEKNYDPCGCLCFISPNDLIRSAKKDGRPKGNYLFVMYHTHGTGGGKRVGSKANALEDLGYIDCDCIVRSHTHQPMAFKQDFFRTDRAHHQVSQVTRLFVNSNAFLRFGGYGEKMGYKPATMEVPRIKIYFSNRHKGNDIDMRAVI